MNDNWYPECDDCGCGNLVNPVTFCEECWKRLKKKLKGGKINDGRENKRPIRKVKSNRKI